MSFKNIPIVGVGPGSQPQESELLDCISMPKHMDMYRVPTLPEETSLRTFNGAYDVLREVARELGAYRVGTPTRRVALTALGEADREIVNQILGEGEVSALIAGEAQYRIQESILPGVWRIQEHDPEGALRRDEIEIGAIPQQVLNALDGGAQRSELVCPPEYPEGVVNAPSLLVEIAEQARHTRPGDQAHLINLTLMPITPEDLSCLEGELGVGPVTILSRGFGNCRVTSTGLRNAWWVRYYNSMDTLILNTLEVVSVPAVACAAQQDIDDNAERLTEIMEIFQ